MKVAFSGAVASVVFGMAVFAQTPPQSPNQTPSSTAQQTRQSSDQQVTVTGCVQREADYRRARDAGRGGVVGTGVGAGNEFVLANASMSGAAPTGTAGTSSTGTAYELTGKNEGQVQQVRRQAGGDLRHAQGSRDDGFGSAYGRRYRRCATQGCRRGESGSPTA